MAKFLVTDPGEFIAIDPKSGEEKFRVKTNIADANGEWSNNFVKEVNNSINKKKDTKDAKKEPPVLPKYIEDYSTDKEEKDRIKKEFPEFILED